eukprot:SAG31_NODE_36707_length_311_cov_0.721698_1_plen_98_part_10
MRENVCRRYATLCALAGVDPTDHRAAAAGLPPIDSYSLVPILRGTNLSAPRIELALGGPISGGGAGSGTDADELPVGAVTGLIRWPWKLLIGDVPMGG